VRNNKVGRKLLLVITNIKTTEVFNMNSSCSKGSAIGKINSHYFEESAEPQTIAVRSRRELNNDRDDCCYSLPVTNDDGNKGSQEAQPIPIGDGTKINAGSTSEHIEEATGAGMSVNPSEQPVETLKPKIRGALSIKVVAVRAKRKITRNKDAVLKRLILLESSAVNIAITKNL
jgi:hypothetical protein